MTVMQTVERLRSNNLLPGSGQISLRNLTAKFKPPAGSVRLLILKMLDGVVAKRPWAVILCRFKGDPPNKTLEDPVKNLFGQMFAPGSGGLIEYWRDASLGSVDISGSKVTDWIELDIERSKAGGIGRAALVQRAIDAAKKKGFDPVNGFFSQIAVVRYNWSTDDPNRPPGTPSWTPDDPLKPWWGTWIDGSSDGKIVALTPPFDGDITAHEMGHVFGMNHDVDADLNTDYRDPCCIMSQNGSFVHPVFNVNFGPAICLPHLLQKNWMYSRRLYTDNGNWMNDPNGITLPLAAINTPVARANLGIKLAFNRDGNAWDYYLEYVPATDWNRGLPGAPYVFIRRMSPKYNGTPAYLKPLFIPSVPGETRTVIEPSGNVQFTVEFTSLPGPIVKVTAKKL